ncbi:hypothetical protein AUR64_17330 [Haloprofundus marisrubri]|uniref:Uncharacterized protein n=1 Tax=Haloprofundus marisrubri TaxID=1514971 RepID=A0A0W1R888_9EURY|nr:TATA-box-binding protein [Haloprofundus marisrubri]KTG09529.1 hypothetical protein AUR64_17330 [Haloprofundus marisrubri]
MVEVVNLVGGGEVGAEIDLSQLHADVDEIVTEYDPGRHWQLVLRFPEQDALVIAYRTGKYIVRSGSSLDALYDAKSEFAHLLARRKIIADAECVTFALQNMVCTGDLGTPLDLNAVCLQLGLEHTEYEPEQFPGLVYRPPDKGVVMLIFGTGKVVVTSVTDQSEAEAALETLREALEL